MPDQSQHDREPGGRQEPSVFFIRYLPYLAFPELSDGDRRKRVPCVTYQSKGIWGELGLLEKRNGDFAGDDTQICSIGCLEEFIV